MLYNRRKEVPAIDQQVPAVYSTLLGCSNGTVPAAENRGISLAVFFGALFGVLFEVLCGALFGVLLRAVLAAAFAAVFAAPVLLIAPVFIVKGV